MHIDEVKTWLSNPVYKTLKASLLIRCEEQRMELASLLLNSSSQLTGEIALKEVLHSRGTLDVMIEMTEEETIIDLITNANLMESEDD